MIIIRNIIIYNKKVKRLTVIETLASLIPVNSLLYLDIIKDNINGMKYNNMEELISLIKNLYHHRDYIERMREYTEVSVAQFSISETTKKIVDIYGEEVEHLWVK